MAQNPPAILVVDDDDAVRTMLTELLEDDGYVVRTATNGALALAILEACPEDIGLILLDVMMPDMNGWQFLTVQRHDAALNRIPVIALSAGAHVHGQGFPYDVPFVHKPFETQQLLTAVGRVLRPPLRMREVGS